MKSLKSEEPGEAGSSHCIRWIRNVEDLIWMFAEIMEAKRRWRKMEDREKWRLWKKKKFSS